MKRRLKFIFFIATITAVGITVCQLYWVYYNYVTAKATFVKSATYSLKQSIDKYQLSQNILPTSLKAKSPSFTFFMRTIPNGDPLALDTPDSKRRFHAEFATVSVDQEHLPQVKALIARLMSQQKHKPLNLDTLNAIFRKELLKNDVDEQFHLVVERGVRKVGAHEITAVVNFYKDPVIVKAELNNERDFFLKNNFSPALVSSFLILLSAASLYYMGTIINRQMLIDSIKTDFINNITHELRTPVTILKSSNEAMSKFGADDEATTRTRYLNINSTVLDELDHNIERILSFSQIEHGQLKPNFQDVNFRDIAEKAIQLYRIADDISIDIITDTVPFIIRTDKYMLSIIISNLVDNAVKYSPGQPKVAVSAKGTVKKWQLEVSDKGQGIPAASLPFIFDKFYRVGTGDLQDVKGYGIGLAFVQQLVKILNGKISVTSKVGIGTTFIITFNS